MRSVGHLFSREQSFICPRILITKKHKLKFFRRGAKFRERSLAARKKNHSKINRNLRSSTYTSPQDPFLESFGPCMAVCLSSVGERHLHFNTLSSGAHAFDRFKPQSNVKNRAKKLKLVGHKIQIRLLVFTLNYLYVFLISWQRLSKAAVIRYFLLHAFELPQNF